MSVAALAKRLDKLEAGQGEAPAMLVHWRARGQVRAYRSGDKIVERRAGESMAAFADRALIEFGGGIVWADVLT